MRPSADIQTRQLGQLHIIQTAGITQIQLPPPAVGARKLWNSLRSRVTGAPPPEHTSIKLSAHHLTLPTQQIPLENIEGFEASARLMVRFGGEEVVVETGLTGPEGQWLHSTIQTHIARRRAALATLKQLRRS